MSRLRVSIYDFILLFLKSKFSVYLLWYSNSVVSCLFWRMVRVVVFWSCWSLRANRLALVSLTLNSISFLSFSVAWILSLSFSFTSASLCFCSFSRLCLTAISSPSSFDFSWTNLAWSANPYSKFDSFPYNSLFSYIKASFCFSISFSLASSISAFIVNWRYCSILPSSISRLILLISIIFLWMVLLSCSFWIFISCEIWLNLFLSLVFSVSLYHEVYG